MKLSNLDLNDKLVKKGVLISYHGLRGLVIKVRMGRCICRETGINNRPILPFKEFTVNCESVQVVK